MNGYLTKPLDPEKLRRLIEELSKRPQLPQLALGVSSEDHCTTADSEERARLV